MDLEEVEEFIDEFHERILGIKPQRKEDSS